MNITIKIFGPYSYAYITIYNSLNNIVYEEKLCDNKIDICLKKGIYKIKINTPNKRLISSFYVDNNKYYYFYLNNNKTILLTDYNYNGLPIEKGLLFFS